MKYTDFRKSITKPIFSWVDIRLRKLPVFRYQISLWHAQGSIEQLKRGLYVFVDRKDEVRPEEVSYALYQPSYISMEYALSYYGFIPEAVPVITAVASKATRTCTNNFGRFVYRRLAPEFFFGYEVKQTPHGKYCIAQPEKALFDFLYLNPRTMRNRDDLEEMRINYDAFKGVFDWERAQQYLDQFHCQRLTRLARDIRFLCSHSHK